MKDEELLAIAKQTVKILKESKCGLDDVVSLIKLLTLRIEELTQERKK